MPTYSENPQYWWETKGGRYLEERKTEEALDTETLPLYNLARYPEIKSVLEVGCGFGRLLRPLASFSNLERVGGLDFSSSQFENAQKYLDGFEVTLGLFDLVADMPIVPLNPYDLVFTHGVFTHIPPFQIKKAVANLKQFASKCIVLIEFELREGSTVKEFDGLKYNEIGSYMAAGDTDTWAYDFEPLLDNDIELEKVAISRNFKNPPFGHTTFICKKKSFYEVAREIDEILKEDII